VTAKCTVLVQETVAHQVSNLGAPQARELHGVREGEVDFFPVYFYTISNLNILENIQNPR
jgi:hypothetical protein